MELREGEGAGAATGWRIVRVAREAFRRWQAGWRATPRTARRRWLQTVAVGFLLVLALMVAVAWLAARYVGPGPLPGEPAFDLRLIQALHIKFNAAIWLQTPGTDIPLILVLVATVGPLAWQRRALDAASVLWGYVLVYTVVNVSWMVWARHRPTVIAGGIAAPGFSSFPSGHTAKAFTVYGVLAYLWARRTASLSERVVAFLFAFAVSTMVAVGRLGMGAHWPSDVAGGALFGLLMMLVMILALRGAERASGTTPRVRAARAEDRGRTG